MKKYALAFLATMALGMVNPAHAGQIEVDGVWYTADEAKRFVGKQARILVIPGLYFGSDNDHLWERFWGFSTFELELRDIYGVFKASYTAKLSGKHSLTAVTVKNSDRDITATWWDVLAFLVAGGSTEEKSATGLLTCLEIRGTLELSPSQIPGAIANLTLVPTFQSMLVGNDKIPFSWNTSTPQVSIAEATILCTSPRR